MDVFKKYLFFFSFINGCSSIEEMPDTEIQLYTYSREYLLEIWFDKASKYRRKHTKVIFNSHLKMLRVPHI